MSLTKGTLYNLFKYSKYYSRQEPRFVEGDIFKIIVPLDDDYSYDYVIKNEEINSKKVPIKKYWKKM